MRLSFILSVAAVAGLGLGVSYAANAKTLAEAASPANFPPADFQGRTFVDNDGCVYMRAGFDGNVQWVPRVTRSRTVVCGQTPTFGTTRVAVAPTAVAPAATPTPTPVATPAPTPVAVPVAATVVAAAPAARVAATPAPRVVQRVAAPPALAAPLVAVTSPQPTTPFAQRRVISSAGSNCANQPASSQPFFNTGSGVRCGPQVQDPSAGFRAVRSGQAVAGQGALGQGGTLGQGDPVYTSVGAASTAGLRIVPAVPPVPEGFQRVWQDDRLNPNRGVPGRVAQSVNAPKRGYDLAWTRNAPHILFDRKTGLVVGNEFPGLVYPNIDPSTIVEAASVTASTKAAPVGVLTAQPVQRTTNAAALVTRQIQPRAEVLTNRHVQAATFANIAQARSAAQRLATSGLRTRIGTFTRNGQQMQVLVLGPFNSASEVNRAIGTARSLGFSGAYASR